MVRDCASLLDVYCIWLSEWLDVQIYYNQIDCSQKGKEKKSNDTTFYTQAVIFLPCARYLFGWLSQDVPHPSSTPEAVTQYCDNAHEQGVTCSLLVLDHHRWRLDGVGRYRDTPIVLVIFLYRPNQTLFAVSCSAVTIQWCLKAPLKLETLDPIHNRGIWTLISYPLSYSQLVYWIIRGLWGHLFTQEQVTRLWSLVSLEVMDREA